MQTNQALSAFLTAKRAAITPAAAGVPVTGPRRVPGLRREEVAYLSGVSMDWYVRLEQGRQITPSESVLAAVARTLSWTTPSGTTCSTWSVTPPPVAAVDGGAPGCAPASRA